jgi:hypothetical protein
METVAPKQTNDTNRQTWDRERNEQGILRADRPQGVCHRIEMTSNALAEVRQQLDDLLWQVRGLHLAAAGPDVNGDDEPAEGALPDEVRTANESIHTHAVTLLWNVRRAESFLEDAETAYRGERMELLDRLHDLATAGSGVPPESGTQTVRTANESIARALEDLQNLDAVLFNASNVLTGPNTETDKWLKDAARHASHLRDELTAMHAIDLQDAAAKRADVAAK